MSGREKPTENAGSTESGGVVCAKCDHENPRGRNLCESCGAHLHIVCHRCGHRNARVQPRCVECGHKLHRSWWKRGWLSKDRKMALIQVALLVLGILAGLFFVIYFSEYRLPEPEL